MAIRYYDQALVDKITKWIKDPNLRVLSPSDTSRFFQMSADQRNDKPMTLPMVAISRTGGMEIINTNKRPLTYDGGKFKSAEEWTKTLNAIPIKLTYQLDIYTRYFAEADEYVRNFVFNFINYPSLSIDIPYNNAHIQHTSNVLVESNVSDNSDIQERLIQGQFTRMTINLTIDDAWLFSVPFMENWKVNNVEVELAERK